MVKPLESSNRWVVLIVAATLAAYWPAVHGSMLWDDSGHVTRPTLQSLDGLRKIWFEPGETQQYYPLLHSAFWLEHRMWGDSVAGYHLVNILLHATSACVLVFIVRTLFHTGSLLAGILFALHPICVEAVAWISEQKSTLSGLFYLLSFLIYLIFDRDRRKVQYLLALGLFILALLSKTVTATLPVALLIAVWWRRGKLEWKRDVGPLVPWGIIGCASGLFTAYLEWADIGAHGADFNLSVGQRCLIAARALWFYLGKVLWPTDLTFIYPRWDVNTHLAWQYAFPVGVIAVFLFSIVSSRRGWRGPLFAILYFGVTLFPVLGFLNVYPFRYSFVADHFQYLACLAILVPAAVTLSSLTSQKLRITACIFIPLSLGVLTWRQSQSYSNPEVIYRSTLNRNPLSWMAHNNLGNLLAQTPGRVDEAVQEYQTALRLHPNDAEAHYNLANLLLQDDLHAAIAHYQIALRLEPAFGDAHLNLASALSRLPFRWPDAVKECEEAVRLMPTYAVAHFNLANLLSQSTSTMLRAVSEYRAAIQLKADFLEAHYNLALILENQMNSSPEVVSEYEAVLRIKPDHLEARLRLGKLLASVPSRLQEAIAQNEAALQIDPTSERAHYNLAVALAQTPGRSHEAVEHLKVVLEIQPGFTPARQLMAQLLQSDR